MCTCATSCDICVYKIRNRTSKEVKKKLSFTYIVKILRVYLIQWYVTYTRLGIGMYPMCLFVCVNCDNNNAHDRRR